MTKGKRMGIMEKSFRNRKEDEDKDLDEDEIVGKRQRIFPHPNRTVYAYNEQFYFYFLVLCIFSKIAYNKEMTQYFPRFPKDRRKSQGRQRRHWR